MARIDRYQIDSDVTASDRLTGIDSLDNTVKNFTVDSIAQLFASTGIANPSKLSFYYTVGNQPIPPAGGVTFVTGNIPGPAGITQININKFDNSGRGTDNTGFDFTPLRRFVVGNNIELADVGTVDNSNYAIYSVTRVTEVGDSLELGVSHLASSGHIPLTNVSLTVINGAPIEGGQRGNAIFDGVDVPTFNNPPAIDGDIYIRLFDNEAGDPQVDLYLNENQVWSSPLTLTGVQGYQGISVSEISSDADPDNPNPGGLTTVTVDYVDPVPGSATPESDTFEIQAGFQGTGVQAITQTNTPELGEDTEIEVTYNDPSGNTPPASTPLTVKAGIQGDQGLFYLTLFKVYPKTPIPTVTAPEGVIFNETTGFTNLPIDGWHANPQDHNVSTQSLYELRQDVNPSGAYDADRNITFTAASWGAAFLAGDQGPQGVRGYDVRVVGTPAQVTTDGNGQPFKGTLVTLQEYNANAGEFVDGTQVSVYVAQGNDITVGDAVEQPNGDFIYNIQVVDNRGSDIGDPIPVTSPKGDQGFQGISITDVSSDTPNPVAGDTQVLTFATEDPANSDQAGTLTTTVTLPPGAPGVNSVLTNATGLVNREATVGNEMATVTDGVLTISLTPHMGTVIDSPHPQDAVAPNRTQTYTGTTLDYAVTITDVYPSVYTYTLTSVTRLSGDTNFVIPSITAGTSNSVTISTAATGSATFRAQLVATHAGSSQTTVTHHDFALHSIAPVVPTDTYRTRETDSENFNTDLGNYTNSNITPAFGTRITFRRPDGVSGDWFGYLAIPRSVLVLDPELNFNSGVAVPDPIGTDVGTPAFDFFRFPFTGPIKVIEITE